MLSIGVLRAILKTGINVAIKATKTETTNINTICLIPNIKSVKFIPKSFIIELLISLHTTPQAIVDKTKLIAQITALSLKKIEKTSLPLAPIALSTPISRFL